MNEETRSCPKCGRFLNCVGGLERHRIIAGVAGGEYTDDNVFPLCFVCHKEWHSFEAAHNLSFKDWISLPPGHDLAVLYFVLHQKSQDAPLSPDLVGKAIADIPLFILRVKPENLDDGVQTRDFRVIIKWLQIEIDREKTR